MARLFPALFFAASLLAQQSTGPSAGSKVLDFEAVDQNGQSHKLTSILGPKGAIIVFYRSADW
jgi:hypothetical protein